MIVRRKEYAKREPSRDAHKIYIVCEGKGTEPAYFSFFEGLSSNLQLLLKAILVLKFGCTIIFMRTNQKVQMWKNMLLSRSLSHLPFPEDMISNETLFVWRMLL